jgi:hypothetical protein
MVTRAEIKELIGKFKTNEDAADFFNSKTPEEQDELRKAFKSFRNSVTEEEFREVMESLGKEGRDAIKANSSAVGNLASVIIGAIDKATTKQ